MWAISPQRLALIIWGPWVRNHGEDGTGMTGLDSWNRSWSAMLETTGYPGNAETCSTQCKESKRKTDIKVSACLLGWGPSALWFVFKDAQYIGIQYKLSSDELRYSIIQSIMRSEMCSLHLTHPSAQTWSSGQPTMQRPGCSHGLSAGAGIRTHTVMAGFKSNALSTRPRLPSICSGIYWIFFLTCPSFLILCYLRHYHMLT